MKYKIENTVNIGKPQKVFLDGLEIDNVFECDTENGYVIFAELDTNGHVQLEGDEVKTNTRYGNVTVEPIRVD